MKIGIKYVVVFQEDGLDLDGVLEDLKKYGTVTEVEDNKLDEETPVKMIYMDSSLGGFTRLKLDYNCVSAPVNKYVLFPMASRKDKLQVMREWG